MPDRNGPCSPWATRDDLVYAGPCAQGADVPSGDVLDAALMMASTILFRLSGANWTGVCTDSVRPVLSPRFGWLLFGGIYGPPIDVFASSDFSLSQPGSSLNSLSRWFPYGWSSEQPLDAVRLVSPVQAITTVVVDGVTMDPGRYALVDRALVVRTDGEPWPVLQDVRVADTEVGTMRVDYTFGKPVPQDARIVCAILACEIARSWSPDPEGSRLPRNITQLTGEGMTMQVIDPGGAFDSGDTGIPEVDLWLNSVRSTRRRPVLMSADGWQRSRLRRRG